MYNESWKAIVKMRLLPREESPQDQELLSEVLLEASLVCHAWKSNFIDLVGSLPETKPNQFLDVWDALIELSVPSYSEAEFQRYSPLFAEGVSEIIRRLDDLNGTFADILSPQFRALLIRARRQLRTESHVYLRTPELLQNSVLTEESVPFFSYTRFVGVLRTLRDIARAADLQRDALN